MKPHTPRTEKERIGALLKGNTTSAAPELHPLENFLGRIGPFDSSQYSVINRKQFRQTDFTRIRSRVSGKVHQCIASERHRAVESVLRD